MKYSVIVPVYNVESFLPQCVDSILACDNSDLELLLVDDGSTDGSAHLCDAFSARDNRVKVFHKPNGGVSSARNLGLEHAQGEWIMFVDSDDWVSPDFFDLPETSADIIERPYSRIDEKGNVVGLCRPACDRILTEEYELFRYFVNERINVLWNKVIRRSLVGATRFNESVSVGEDFLFYLAILLRVKRYEFSDKGEYFYLLREGSTMSNITTNRRITILYENMEHIKTILNSDKYADLMNGILCVTYFPLLCLSQRSMSHGDLDKMKEQVASMSSGSFRYVPFRLRIKVLLKNWLLRLK